MILQSISLYIAMGLLALGEDVTNQMRYKHQQHDESRQLQEIMCFVDRSLRVLLVVRAKIALRWRGCCGIFAVMMMLVALHRAFVVGGVRSRLKSHPLKPTDYRRVSFLPPTWRLRLPVLCLGAFSPLHSPKDQRPI